MSEKTEKPSPKKLRDARKKGQVASSKEVASAALILSVFVYIAAMSDTIYLKLEQMILLPTEFINDDFEHALQATVEGIAQVALHLLAPLLVVVVIIAVLAYIAQFGVLMSAESLKPSLNKLNPAKAVKKIFSVKNLIEFLKSILKIVFLSVLLYFVIRHSLPDLLKIPACGLDCIPLVLGTLLKHLAINAAFAFIIIAAADFAFQKYQFTKQMRMTKDEVKREYKEMEGDPLIKGKRKQLHQEMLSENITHSVKNSTVVVTNPTRIAIALEYRDGETPLPIVRAKGENLIARRMIEIAKQEGIPVMENVPLARALHEHSSVDQYIPADLIDAVAEVLRWVIQLEEQS
ncbi:MAG: EscU/YscU/HrcU family type III secretion system export apparatus switch protein [Sulfitobacter sp.]|nr:EscU/YscU/HrcU family type III secretion system export apparatus switch protein [Sulfitobacter sp.]